MTERFAPDFSPSSLERQDRLARDLARAPLSELLRLFTAAGHELLHRDVPRPFTAASLTEALVAEVEQAHREGLS